MLVWGRGLETDGLVPCYTHYGLKHTTHKPITTHERAYATQATLIRERKQEKQGRLETAHFK